MYIMRQLFFSYLALAVILFCTSCSSQQYQVLFQKKNAISDTSSQKNAVTVKYYRIQPQDILQIRNLQDDRFIVNQTPVNLNTNTGMANDGQTFQVKEDGTITMPDIGTINVLGMTRIEAQKLVEDSYRKVLLKDPIIDLKIVNLKVTLLGEVKDQGNFPLIKDKTTLVELIGQAGGLTDKANEKNVKIIRGTEKNPKVIQIDLGDLQSINDPASVLQSGDIIYIAQNKRAARSNNLQNFSIILQPALILLNTLLIIFTLTRR